MSRLFATTGDGLPDPLALSEKRLDAAKAERDAAEKKRGAAKAERDAAKAEWANHGEPDNGPYYDMLKDAQAAVQDAQAAVRNAENAVVSAQANVDAAIAALTTNGNGGRADRWERADDTDTYPAQLLKAYHAAAELEKSEELAPGAESPCGSVKHLGAGVFLEPRTPPIDPDSAATGAATLTRRETRFMARAAVDAVLDRRRSKGKVVVVGQPGTGKTRGGLTATIQELLGRGVKTILRVGYKNRRAYLMKKNDQTGEYNVWERSVANWDTTAEANDPSTVAVIDPPEGSSNYVSSASCSIVMFASNNSQNHFPNIEKDGVLLVTAMPVEEDTTAVTEFLWDPRTTPRPDDPPDPSPQDKVDEILRRSQLVGHSWRELFSWSLFRHRVPLIRSEAVAKGLSFSDHELVEYFAGRRVENVEGGASASWLFFLNPANLDTSDAAGWQSRTLGKGVELLLNPLAAAVLSDRIFTIVSQWKGTRDAAKFEDLCFSILRRGIRAEGPNTPARSPLAPNNNLYTYELLKTVGRNAGKVVRTPHNFPVVDFFTCVSDLYNAKVGDNPIQTRASALVAFLTHSGAATVDETGNTVRMTSSEFKPTLTFLRNSDNNSHSLDLNLRATKKKTTTAESEMDVEKPGITNAQVAELFESRFTVKFVNVCDIQRAELENVDKVLAHYGLAAEEVHE